MKNIEIRPCHCGDFDFAVSQNPHQVRIKLSGWIGKLMWYLMYRKWKRTGHSTITLDGEWKAIEHWKPILAKRKAEGKTPYY